MQAAAGFVGGVVGNRAAGDVQFAGLDVDAAALVGGILFDPAAGDVQRVIVVDAAAVVGLVAGDGAALQVERAVVDDAAAVLARAAGDLTLAGLVLNGQRRALFHDDGAAVVDDLPQTPVQRIAVQVQRDGLARRDDERLIVLAGAPGPVQGDGAAVLRGVDLALQVGPVRGEDTNLAVRVQAHAAALLGQEELLGVLAFIVLLVILGNGAD